MKNNNIKKQKQMENLQIQDIEINNIVVSYNPRKSFDEEKIKELAESIKNIGVIQPITVRPSDKGKFEIVCGERRYRASLLAEKKTIPAYIRECSDDERIEIAFVENLQREDLTDIELAESIKDLIDSGKEDINSMAKRLGKSTKFVSDRYNLNDLNNKIKSLLNSGAINLGKAVLLSRYNAEIQRDIYQEHLKDENSNYYWGGLSYSKFAERINSSYNCNLQDVEFDKSECQTCRYNSAVGNLFAEDLKTMKCLDQACFEEKRRNFQLNKAIAQIEEHPDYSIINYNGSEWLCKELKNKGFEIVEKLQFALIPEEPKQPKKPSKDDYIIEQTGEFNEDDYNDNLRIYTLSIDQYNKDLEEYQQALLDVDQAVLQGIKEYCFYIWGNKICLAYREIRPIDGQESDTTNIKTSQATIEKLKEKDKRNKEIKIENTVKDLKDQVLKTGVDLSATKGVQFESDLLFYYLLQSLSSENQERLFGKQYPSEQERFDLAQNITEEQRTIIIRDFLMQKLREYAFSSKRLDTRLLIDFAKLHFEQETSEIEQKYEDVYNKRLKTINEKIKEAQNESNDTNK